MEWDERCIGCSVSFERTEVCACPKTLVLFLSCDGCSAEHCNCRNIPLRRETVTKGG